MGNRRDFIKGFGALLATSAMVRPPLPEIETLTASMEIPIDAAAMARGDAAYWISNEERIFVLHPQQWLDIAYQSPCFWFDGINCRFGVPTVSQQTVDETLRTETQALDDSLIGIYSAKSSR